MTEFFIHIDAGQVTNKQVLENILRKLTSGRYLVKIKKHNKRTLNQNAYYHGIVVPLVKDGLIDIGYNEIKTNEDAHEVIKYLFLKKTIPNEHTGEAIELLGSTKELSTTEFILFIQEIQQWAAEFLNIQIPDPNEQLQVFK